MAITVKFRRGSTTESNAFLGEEGELYIDKDKDTVVVHDGVTTGGFRLASEAWVTQAISNFGTSSFSGSYNDLTNKPTLFSGAYADLTGLPTLFSGSYNDLTDKPALFSGAYADLSGKPALATVATSGSYNDLSGLPTLFSGSYNDLTNKPVLFSGSYNDLIDKPTIPSLTGYATETYVNTQVANLVDTAPTTLDTLNELAAALGDDPNFATTIASQIGLKANSADLATVATTGSYNDLLNKPTGLATESWVTSQNYLTSITSSQVAQTLTGITNSSFGASAYAGNSSSYITQQIGHSAMLVGATSGNSNKFAMLLANAYASDTGERFMRDGTASRYMQNGGIHLFQTSNVNGTASSLATWTTTLLMDLNGNIGIKKENPSYPIDVNGTARATSFVIGTNSGDKWEVLVDNTSNTLFFKFGGVNKMKLDTSGNLTVTGDVTAFGTV